MGRITNCLLKLNRRQTRALVAGVIAIVLIGFYPPWYHEYQNEVGGRRTVSAGFGSLTSPPVSLSPDNYRATHVDLVVLLTEWVIATAITFGAIIYMADRNPDTTRLLHRYER